MKDKDFEKLIGACMSERDISNNISDDAKDASYTLVEFNYDGLYELLKTYYARGFKDGHKTASGVQKDEWGNWVDE